MSTWYASRWKHESRTHNNNCNYKAMAQYHIAITNDDGIDSPGLRASVEAAAGLGRITIVAPTDQQTATGRGLTGDKKTAFKRVDYTYTGGTACGYHCPCSPAQVVRHALHTVFLNDRPDLLISGVNYGENLGNMVTSSGTVGAAIEAASQGIPALAVSKQTDIASHKNYTDQNWDAVIHFLRMFAEKTLRKTLLPDVDVLKIDVPDNADEQTVWKLTSLSRAAYYTKTIENPSVESVIDDFTTQIADDPDAFEPGSDIHALAVERVVSVTPISIDLTSRVDFTELNTLLGD